MSLIVQKFGGTSVADVERIRNVARRVVATREAGHQVAVIVSAMAGETNQLVALAEELGGVDRSDREYDVLVSTGEQKTIALLAMAIHKLGWGATSFTGAQMGMRTDDVRSWAQFLAGYRTTPDRPTELHLAAIGEAAIPALHAAALDTERFASVRLRNMISSWAEVVSTPENLNQAANVVHGALKHYDLPDLIDLAGANKVRIEEPVDVMGNPVASK